MPQAPKRLKLSAERLCIFIASLTCVTKLLKDMTDGDKRATVSSVADSQIRTRVKCVDSMITL
jgi:hypothetical protein